MNENLRAHQKASLLLFGIFLLFTINANTQGDGQDHLITHQSSIDETKRTEQAIEEYKNVQITTDNNSLEDDPKEQHKQELRKRFSTVTQEFSTLCNNLFSPLALSGATRDKYFQFRLLWNMQKKKTNLLISSINDEAIGEESAKILNNLIKQHIMTFELLTIYLKSIHLKLELLTIGSDETSHAFVKNPLSQSIYQRLLIEVLLMASDHLYRFFEEADNKILPLSNQNITDMIKQNFPIHLFEPFLIRLLKFIKKSSPIYTALKVDVYNISPSLFDSYIDFVTSYNQIKHKDNSNKTLNKLFQRIDNLLENFEETKTDISHTDKKLYANFIKPINIKKALNLFISKLLKIKQEILLANQRQKITSKKPALLNLFVHHNNLVQSTQFDYLQKNLSSPEQKIIDRYLELTNHFFNITSTTSNLFLYKTPETIYELRQLEAKYQRCFLKELWYGEESKEAQACSQMIHILEQIELSMTQNNQNSTSNYGEIINYVISGEWLGSNPLKIFGADGKNSSISKLAQQFLDNPHMGNIKKAAFYTLGPLLISKLLKYVLPSLNKNLGKKAETLLKEAEKTDKENGNSLDKMIDFVNKNPGLFEQLSQSHPELIDLLVMQFKNILKKEQSLAP